MASKKNVICKGGLFPFHCDGKGLNTKLSTVGQKIVVPGLTLSNKAVFTVCQMVHKVLQIHRWYEWDRRMCDFCYKTYCIVQVIWQWHCQNSKNNWHLEGHAAFFFRTEMTELQMTSMCVLFCCYCLLTVETHQRRKCCSLCPGLL